MKTVRVLYWISYIPTAPLFAASWAFYGAAISVNYVGNLIHDHTTFPLWRLLHEYECETERRHAIMAKSEDNT